MTRKTRFFYFVATLLLIFGEHAHAQTENSLPVDLSTCSPVFGSIASPYTPLKQVNGENIPDEFLDKSKALGQPESNSAQNATSLGMSGEIVIAFEKVIVNLPSQTDVKIFEYSESDNCDQNPERALIAASQDGYQWVDLGQVCMDAELDLGTLQWAKYLRISDISDPTKFGPTDNGYDVDAVQGSNCLSEPLVPFLQCLTEDLNKDGISDGVRTAIFGYENGNPYSIDVLVSGYNQTIGVGAPIFTGAFDAGQPRTFLPGRRESVFTVQVTSPQVTWILSNPIEGTASNLVVNLDAEFERCGDCNAGGVGACLSCTESNIRSIKSTLENSVLVESNAFLAMSKFYVRNASDKKKARKAAKRFKEEADQLALNMLTIAQQLPDSVTTCGETPLCSQLSILADRKNSYLTQSESLKNLTSRVLRKSSGKKAKKKQLQTLITNAHQSSLDSAGQIPSSDASCG